MNDNSSRHSRHVVVVGASASGLRCAARLARREPSWRLTVLEERHAFSFAACGMPYVLSGDVGAVEELRKAPDGALRDPDYFASVKGVQVLSGARAVAVDAGGHTVRLANGQTLAFDELVLAVGSRPTRLPGQPEHVRVHTFHTLADLLPLLGALKTGKLGSVVVVGGGLCGCELAEAFSVTWGAEVTQLETAAHVLPAALDLEVATLAEQALLDNSVQLRTNTRVEAIVASDDSVTVRTGDAQFAADAVVVAVGVDPAVELAQSAGVALGRTGAIAVDDRFRTSVPHVWACGDCIEVRHALVDRAYRMPLGSLANRQGRLLADILTGSTERFSPVADAIGLSAGIARNPIWDPLRPALFLVGGGGGPSPAPAATRGLPLLAA